MFLLAIVTKTYRYNYLDILKNDIDNKIEDIENDYKVIKQIFY